MPVHILMPPSPPDVLLVLKVLCYFLPISLPTYLDPPRILPYICWYDIIKLSLKGRTLEFFPSPRFIVILLLVYFRISRTPAASNMCLLVYETWDSSTFNFLSFRALKSFNLDWPISIPLTPLVLNIFRDCALTLILDFAKNSCDKGFGNISHNGLHLLTH